ncbi:MAG: hypothetical protein GY856_12365 [bacterium]|nr:hypothetical protein [bacterium]
MDGRQPEEDPSDPCSRGADDGNALIDPCRDEPERFLAFKDATLVCLDRRAEQTRDVCGLDREDLESARNLWLVVAVETAARAYQFAVQQGLDAEEREFRSRLKELLRPFQPYVAMTRAKLTAMGIEPDTL